MITSDFDKLPDASSLWVYQSSRPFTSHEKTVIEAGLKQFLSQWAAHGQALLASYKIEYDQFIIIAVDESQVGASGCSIDASVGFMREIEKEFQLNLLDRSQVAVLNEGSIQTFPFNQIKQAIVSASIEPNTVVFNNSTASVGEWKSSWKQKAVDSWMGRFFPSEA